MSVWAAKSAENVPNRIENVLDSVTSNSASSRHRDDRWRCRITISFFNSCDTIIIKIKKVPNSSFVPKFGTLPLSNEEKKKIGRS